MRFLFKSFNVNYSGHGGLKTWATESIFANPDVADLDNSGKYPFVIGMSCLTGNFGYVSASKGKVPSLAETLLLADAEGAVAALMPTAMTTTTGQHILNTALFEAFFSDDIRELGAAILSAKQVLLANGSAEYEKISQTFLLFGDPAMALKIPLQRMPTGVQAIRKDNGVRITWNAALDSNGNAVAGYNIYRASSPAGPYSKINTGLVTDTQFVDTDGAVVGAGSATGGGSTYYAVSSEDNDGDENAQSLGISPASLVSSSGSGGGGGCFIDTVSHSVSKQWIWLLVLIITIATCKRIRTEDPSFRSGVLPSSLKLRRTGRRGKLGAEDKGQKADENRKVGRPSAAAVSWPARRPRLWFGMQAPALLVDNRFKVWDLGSRRADLRTLMSAAL